MSRPDDIPQDVWDTAFAAMPPINQEAYDSSPFAQGLHVGFARAILAERERTAPKGWKWELVPNYPKGNVVGACICGSWPGGECLKCPPRASHEATE